MITCNRRLFNSMFPRYKLAAVVTRDTGIQTEGGWVEPVRDHTLDVVAALENAKRDIVTLQQEKEVCVCVCVYEY